MILKFFLDSPSTCKLQMWKNLIFCSQNFRNIGEVKCGNKTALQQQQNKKFCKNVKKISKVSRQYLWRQHHLHFVNQLVTSQFQFSNHTSLLIPRYTQVSGYQLLIRNFVFEMTQLLSSFQQPFCFNFELLRNVSRDIKYAILGPYFDNNRRSMLLYFTSKK